MTSGQERLDAPAAAAERICIDALEERSGSSAGDRIRNQHLVLHEHMCKSFTTGGDDRSQFSMRPTTMRIG